MMYDGFRIYATEHITEAYCKDCGTELREVSNGLLSKSLYCPKCENVYQIKLTKIPKNKITKKYLEQCRKEIGRKNKNE